MLLPGLNLLICGSSTVSAGVRAQLPGEALPAERPAPIPCDTPGPSNLQPHSASANWTGGNQRAPAPPLMDLPSRPNESLPGPRVAALALRVSRVAQSARQERGAAENEKNDPATTTYGNNQSAGTISRNALVSGVHSV
ncbi:hypothetical protein AAFF_G00191230 [Aldrovandia affinis]|uniref:Uncharacterized protein n=1 Tax=Aldrovandia affinis TaxID=143900 RepID=A0AAD7RJ96_9TELE|nr:hypothetical protein AAFF_G00191230 [Aldrovandia affinis]